MSIETALPPGRSGDEDTVRRAILADLFEALDAGGPARAPALLDSLRSKHPGHEQTITRLYAAAIEYERLCASLPGGPGPGAPRLLPGDTLGDFTVVGLLAVGGMSEVYRARQRSLGDRLVALKVVPASVTDGGGRARLRREALALAGLHHPSLVEVHGFGEEGGLLYYAMRLVEGPTLAQVLARASAAGGSTPAWRRAVVAWMADVADALACVHAAELVHRDVKPANVVLQGPSTELPCGVSALAGLGGTAVLVDFGLARPVDAPAGTLTLQHAATPAYAAPEQLLGQGVDGRVDVFALGVSLHDLLTTRLPGARAQASAGLPPLRALLPDVDDDLAAVVARACDPQPRWRYPDAAALRDDLRSWLAGRGVSARRAPLPERLGRAARTRPGRFAAITAGVLVAAGLILAGVVVTASAARSAGVATRAAERGDLLALQDAVRRIPPALDGVLLDAPLAALAPLARGYDDTDALALTCTRLRLDDVDGALREAVTALRVEGPERRPLLTRFLEVALQPGASGTDVEVADSGHLALMLVARLFMERPVLDAGSAQASDGLRRRLLEIAADPSVFEDDRLYALSALTGCAALPDTPGLLESAVAEGYASERHRLALLAVERTVRRAHTLGEIGSVDVDGLWSRFAGCGVDWRALLADTEAPLSFGRRMAVMQLTRALALAARAQGRTLDVSAVTGPRGQDADWWFSEPGLTTALADPAAARGALSALLAGTGAVDPQAWGRVAGGCDEDELVDECAWRVAALGSPENAEGASQAFFDGLSQSRAELAGVQAEVDPDPDTLLGVECKEGWRESVRVADAPPAAAAEPGWEAVASWCFSHDTPALAGFARAAGIRCTPWQQDAPGGDGYLRLGSFGTSEVRFEFEVPDDPGLRRWRFLVQHQLAARRYLPYLGRAMLLVRVDENAGTATDMLTETGMRWQPFPIPVDRLSPGRHVIRLLLEDQSTTTYRVYGARLEQPVRR
ncbi:MAG TPA: serine/threonine-protein kinase [Planctomycetota bacterium]|nr:serine/threonine-protein kinase [Planctomycetota bacterium]